MLSDPVLPQLAQALDTVQMARLFTRHFPADRWRLDSCIIERAKYKPGKNCLICYRLTLRDLRSGEQHEQRWSARFYEPGGAESRYAKALAKPLIPVRHSVPLLYEPSLEMVAWRYPNERKMQYLAALSDPQFLSREILPKLVRQHWEPDCRMGCPKLSLMHYAPEHTATIRVSLPLYTKAAEQTRLWTVFGKTYYNDQGARTQRIMQQLWHSPARRAGTLLIPRPLFYDSDRQTLWQEGLTGHTLLQRWPDDAYPDAWLNRIAASLAALHTPPLQPPNPGNAWLDEELQGLRERSALLASAWPSCRSALKIALHTLQSQAGKLNSMPSATLHGDLHPANIFAIDTGAIALIDLDRVRPGPALADIGSWMAAMLYRALLRGEPPESAQQRNRAFWRAYCQNISPVNNLSALNAALNWAIAIALINERAFRCLTRLKPGRLALLNSLIELAAHISQGELINENHDAAA